MQKDQFTNDAPGRLVAARHAATLQYPASDYLAFIPDPLPPTLAMNEALTRERRLAELVNAAYGLTPEDVELLWATAPPRMPVGRGDAIEDVRE
ncbi:hypothetical protein EYB53_018470 [Candidatus Chloroploca sp. M-50]|uniref:Transcriptional regulator n=1 Tax=Candidatus Chloroploca mongolica TaxID=2528176 RepID=A0ABS4DE34_9CHLR|nr:hypothetical protein [Candidatus Chloroploca mongolica]MBP1467706.1 hypothetical protein [Candidatus Chloroploca mongolica]